MALASRDRTKNPATPAATPYTRVCLWEDKARGERLKGSAIDFVAIAHVATLFVENVTDGGPLVWRERGYMRFALGQHRVSRQTARVKLYTDIFVRFRRLVSAFDSHGFRNDVPSHILSAVTKQASTDQATAEPTLAERLETALLQSAPEDGQSPASGPRAGSNYPLAYLPVWLELLRTQSADLFAQYTISIDRTAGTVQSRVMRALDSIAIALLRATAVVIERLAKCLHNPPASVQQLVRLVANLRHPHPWPLEIPKGTACTVQGAPPPQRGASSTLGHLRLAQNDADGFFWEAADNIEANTRVCRLEYQNMELYPTNKYSSRQTLDQGLQWLSTLHGHGSSAPLYRLVVDPAVMPTVTDGFPVVVLTPGSEATMFNTAHEQDCHLKVDSDTDGSLYLTTIQAVQRNCKVNLFYNPSVYTNPNKAMASAERLFKQRVESSDVHTLLQVSYQTAHHAVVSRDGTGNTHGKLRAIRRSRLVSLVDKGDQSLALGEAEAIAAWREKELAPHRTTELEACVSIAMRNATLTQPARFNLAPSVPFTELKRTQPGDCKHGVAFRDHAFVATQPLQPQTQRYVMMDGRCRSMVVVAPPPRCRPRCSRVLQPRFMGFQRPR